eukprot:TRINITY_DN3731_c0_g1_i1.p1 TRINITY_DN3731_c0_g1~~TRINITY_DN3731_c0_g1_i1.p1  ORF type:complete len:536 (-),score=111.41 TRINITY_DN3731_c0_g1_i1:78-1685(-)
MNHLLNLCLCVLVVVVGCAQVVQGVDSGFEVQKFLKAGYSVELLPPSAEQDVVVDSDNFVLKIKASSVSQEEKERKYDYLKDHYYEFIPKWIATVYDDSDSVDFNTSCFSEYTATLESFTKTGASVKIEAHKKKDLLCTDLFLVSTLDHFVFHEFIIGDESHTINIKWDNETEYLEAVKSGIVIFLIPDGIFGSIIDIWDTYHLFSGLHSFDDGLQFMKDHMNITFLPRNISNFIPDESEIQDGDYIAVFGFSSGFNGVGLASLIALGTGGHTSHTALFLRFDGVLYVVESNNKGIIRTPYREWMNTTGANLVSIIRLRDDLSAKFNSTAAVEFWESVAGLPYGTETFVYGWIDTTNGNYPPPLSGADLPVALILGSNFIKSDIDKVFGEGLNIRLNTTNSSIEELLTIIDALNTTVNDVVNIPELESFVYQNPKGPRMVCDVFALRVYKAAGIFDGVEFQASEFTPKDSYQVQIFADEWKRPQACAGDIPSGICQISGAYWLDLVNFNTIKPYDNMNENCSAVPEDYIRTPSNC